jgi:arginyl-tRNA--protein-N-Asp/Glu arginylyltransferase
MNSLAKLKVFATYPHPCSYLDDREAVTVFIDPNARLDRQLYSALSEQGFRRSGPHVYKPHCARCQACKPARVPVARFRPNRSQRRLLRRNGDLRLLELKHIDDDELYQLYAHYIRVRHPDGDMFPPSRDQYLAFLTREWDATRFFAFMENDALRAVAVMDELDNGLSAVYTFFDPDQPERGLGTWVILQQIALTQRLGLDYLYLGYWIAESPKMAYKGSFRPLEILEDGQWQIVDA